jgi:hypothetical protein
VDIRWTPQKILFELEQIQGSQALRTDIKRAADSYKDQLMKAGLKLDEQIQVTSEQDPLLLLFDTLEQVRTTHKASSNISDVEEEIQILREFLLTLKWEKQEGQWKQIK